MRVIVRIRTVAVFSFRLRLAALFSDTGFTLDPALPDKVRIYNYSDISEMAELTLDNSELINRYFAHFVASGTGRYIENASHSAYVAVIDSVAVPIIVNYGNDSSCYLTSAYVNYILSAFDHVNHVRNKAVRVATYTLLRLLSWVIRRRWCDRTVLVNNWLLATGPELKISGDGLSELTRAVTLNWPGHTIVYRRLHVEATVLPNGYKNVFYRNVYCRDNKDETGRGRVYKQFKRDRVALSRTQLSVSDLSTVDRSMISAIRKLYNDLYLQKYSQYNARLTLDWFTMIIEREWSGVCIQDDSGPVFFGVYIPTSTSMIVSIVGVNTERSHEEGLYRIGMSRLMLEAENRKLPANLSSGSGEFKRHRGAYPVEEYETIYTAASPVTARFAWAVIAAMYNSVGHRLADSTAL